MITRDQSRNALYRFIKDVLPRFIEGGVEITVGEYWKSNWLDSYALMDGWNRIIFKANYGDMPMQIEVQRSSKSDYSFCAKLFHASNTWDSLWTINVVPMLPIEDSGFKFDKLMHPAEEVPF